MPKENIPAKPPALTDQDRKLFLAIGMTHRAAKIYWDWWYNAPIDEKEWSDFLRSNQQIIEQKLGLKTDIPPKDRLKIFVYIYECLQAMEKSPQNVAVTIQNIRKNWRAKPKHRGLDCYFFAEPPTPLPVIIRVQYPTRR